MSISNATAEWQGALKGGKGSMKPAHATDVAFSLATRFEGQAGSNPEEMIGAALAGCFSMALSASLGRAGFTPESIRTDAAVHLDKDGDGFSITAIDLKTVAKIPGIDAEKFSAIAEETKKQCPVSKALAAVPKITLDAKLG